MPTPVMPQIKNIVFLMLENRSLDNVLGWLYRGGTDRPQSVYPAASSPDYDGLATGKYANPSYIWTGAVRSYPVTAVPDGLGADADRVPAYDPYEELKAEGWKGVMNQIFGNQDLLRHLPAPNDERRMLGFLQDYYAGYMIGWQGLDSLWSYTPAQLPTINALARQYAVSDRWFCSVPSQTNPNRAFSLCGTSLGRESNANLFADEQFDATTVFNALAAAGKSWGLYFTDVWKQSKSYTEYTFPWISKAVGNSEIGPLDAFYRRAADGTLPAFTYLEPTWGYGKGVFFKQGTDMHPPTHVLPGDNFLGDVYRAVRDGKQWNETLLIVTFDEHGGTYDHVGPPWGAINPDGKQGASGFDFNLLGVRVPTLLISPFVAPGTVFRAPGDSAMPFDHTSFIKTLLLWAGVDPAAVSMGRRMPQAPTFDGVLAGAPVNDALVALAALTPMQPANAAVPGSLEPPPAGAGQPLNDLFEGVSASVTRAILAIHENLADIVAAVAAYRADPERAEAALTSST
jgi:phospholipase C